MERRLSRARAGVIRFGHHFKLLLEADPQAIAQEGHEDMGLHAALDAVPDRTDGQFTFEGSEGGFHFGKLHVLMPEGVGVMGSRLVRNR